MVPYIWFRRVPPDPPGRLPARPDQPAVPTVDPVHFFSWSVQLYYRFFNITILIVNINCAVTVIY